MLFKGAEPTIGCGEILCTGVLNLLCNTSSTKAMQLTSAPLQPTIWMPTNNGVLALFGLFVMQNCTSCICEAWA